MFLILKEYGEDVPKLKSDLNLRPRIVTSKEPPENMEEGVAGFN